MSTTWITHDGTYSHRAWPCRPPFVFQPFHFPVANPGLKAGDRRVVRCHRVINRDTARFGIMTRKENSGIVAIVVGSSWFHPAGTET